MVSTSLKVLMPEALTIADELPVIVNVSVAAFVVKVIPLPAAIVNVSAAASALKVVCPDTAICLYASVTLPEPLPPPLTVIKSTF